MGLARTLMLGGELKRVFYQPEDPFCDQREADDAARYDIDDGEAGTKPFVVEERELATTATMATAAELIFIISM